MKLVELHIDGFGKLVDRTVQFSPGFNLIFGVNEAGKSTLQQAILSMLYGFFGESRIPKDNEQARWNMLKPWDEKAAYQGSLIYSLNGDQAFKVARTFAPKFNTTLITHPNNVDMSMRFKRAEKGRLFFAEEQLGLTKDVFENVCTVRQAELAALDGSAMAITETLMRFLSSASTDTKAVDAMALLEKILEAEVGLVNAPTQPLFKAQKHLGGLEREQDNVMHLRKILFARIVELNELEQKLEELDIKRHKLRYLQALAESDNIKQQITAINEATTETNNLAKELAIWETWEDFPAELRDDVIKLNSQRNHLQEEIKEAQKEADEATEKLEPINSRIAELTESTASLENARSIPAEEMPQIRELYNELKMATKAKESAQERLQKAYATLEESKKHSAKERTLLQPAIKLGHTKLAKLRHSLTDSRQKMETTTKNLSQTQEEWNETGLTEAQLKELDVVNNNLDTGSTLVNITIANPDGHDLLNNVERLKTHENRLQELYRNRQKLQYLQASTESDAIHDQIAAIGKTTEEVARCAEEVTKWEEWVDFPINLHENLIKTASQRSRIKEELDKIRESYDKANEQLPSLKKEWELAQKQAQELKEAVNTADTPELTNIIQEWEKLTELKIMSEKRCNEAKTALQTAETNFNAEQDKLKPAIELGTTGLAGLRHILNATRDRLTQHAESLSQVETEWTEVGIEEDKFKDMERAAEWIQAGAESDPERSRTLRNIPLFRRSSYSRKELVVYGWLKTAYTNLVQSRTDASETQQEFAVLKAEIQNQFGDLVSDELDDETFEQLGKRLDNHTRASAEVAHKKELATKMEAELATIAQKHYKIEDRLRMELSSTGLKVADLRTALNNYNSQTEQRKRLERTSTKIELLQPQVEKVEADINNWNEKQNALKETTSTLQQILSQAKIKSSTDSLEDGLKQFYTGVENFKRWSEANSVYQGTLKHNSLSNNQAQIRLEASMAELESRLTTMRDEHPEWQELKPDKTYIEYATLSRQNDEEWLSEREKHAQLKNSIHRAIDQARKLYDNLLEMQKLDSSAQETLNQIKTEINDQLGNLLNKSMNNESFDKLEQRLESYLQSAAEVGQKESTTTEREQELHTNNQDYDKRYDSLQTKLAKLNFATTEQADLLTTYNNFTQQCEQKQRLVQEEKELEQLRIQLQSLTHKLDSCQKKKETLKKIEAELCEFLLQQVDIDCSTNTLEAALSRFSEGVKNNERWDRAKSSYEAALKHQTVLPDAKAQLELKVSLAELESTLNIMLEQRPEWAELATTEAAQVDFVLISKTDEERSKVHEQYVNLKSSIAQETNSMRHPAEIDEDINEARVAVEKLEWFRKALELAHGELARASQDIQKHFAPKLETQMKKSLNQISHGRYSQVQIDPKSLTVQLIAPESGNSISVNRLSTGTRDLVYLSLRVGLAQLMSRTGEKLPLLLDDPLVQLDQDRQEEALQFLSLLAETTQVLMFTKDEWMKNWFVDNVKDSPLHKAHILKR